MAVDTLKASAITNADATPVVLNNGRLTRMQVWEAVGTAQATASASIGSTYRLCRIPSNARVSRVLLQWDAFDTTGAGDVGIYQTAANGGAVVDADHFASAVVFTSANTAGTDVTHESTVYGLEDAEKPLWEALGLAADPFRDYDVVVTLTTANGAGATPDITMKVLYGL